jgi:hypothetical protein
MIALRILLSLALPLAFGLAPWLLAVMSTRAAAGVLGAGLLVAAGAVTAVAIGRGLALGRVLSLRPRVMAILLALWSIADVAQIVLISGGGSPGGSGAAAPAWQAYAVLRIPVPGVTTLDLLLFAAIGEHWCRRRGSPVQSAGSGVMGVALADLVPFHVRLPLVPFAFAGWLVIEGPPGAFKGHRRPMCASELATGRRLPGNSPCATSRGTTPLPTSPRLTNWARQWRVSRPPGTERSLWSCNALERRRW